MSKKEVIVDETGKALNVKEMIVRTVDGNFEWFRFVNMDIDSIYFSNDYVSIYFGDGHYEKIKENKIVSIVYYLQDDTENKS